MTRERKDRSGNWLIEHCGGALLRLLHLGNIVGWRAVHNVLSHPKQLPDGLLEVTFAGKSAPDPFLIEIEAYPHADTYLQIRKDIAMLLLDRGVVPDVLLLVLQPKGNLHIEPEHVVASANGLTQLRVRIHVVNLWTISARDLLATNEVSLIPWVPLSRFDDPPKALFEVCRERIEAFARPEEKDNLLAVTRTMAEARYNDVELLNIFGVPAMSLARALLELPVGQRLAAEIERATTIKHVTSLLEDRFGRVPKNVSKRLNAVESQQDLESLLKLAAKCPDLKSFRAGLESA